MDPFLDMFYAVDTDASEVITINELHEYVERNGLDVTMVKRWQELFDPDNTGSITLDSFCDVLGVQLEAARKNREVYVQNVPSLPSDIKKIAANMSLAEQIAIAEYTKKLVSRMESVDRQSLTRQLKEYLDKTYGKSWHVVIVDGSYWITFSHVPEHSFHFQFNDNCFLIWKTSSP